MRVLKRRMTPEVIGMIALILFAGIWCAPGSRVREMVRERSFDLLLPLLPAAASGGPEIAIVDIDSGTLARFGPWPWPRARLATLVAATAAARPAVLGLDILLDGPDRFSGPMLLNDLPTASNPPDIAPVIAQMPGGDDLLGQALEAGPAALGFALQDQGEGQNLPATPILLSTAASLPDVWRANGVVGPVPAVASGARGFGAIVVAADTDGPIRRVPTLVLAGGMLRPGLAVEAVRLAQGAEVLVIDAAGVLHTGAVAVPLGEDAALRIVQRGPAAWAARTVSAEALLSDPTPRAALTGRIVLIGSSAPELGGLRITPASLATPSVQIQAEAIATLLRGTVPYRPSWLRTLELACALALGSLAIALASHLRPLTATALVALVLLTWAGGAIGAVPTLHLLVDPTGPVLVAAGAFAATTLARFARDEWRARLLRARFEQHLAPDVVRRIAADPDALRLKGELREITALFTDIEDFTSMTERADPVELVALLDDYFDMAASIVTGHGGMIEKIVGDAVHAIFNAPFELAGHTERALACALALLESSERVRASSLGQRLRLGRTRIGLETGVVVVGDVGGARKLDYTAHGSTMNTAARLEGANKEFGSSICIGPGAAGRLNPGALRRLGTLTLRGHNRPVDVFTPAVLACRTSAR
ncbi:MAG: adenylate/guanylate cyclase domain-containing protein [Acetobacteraceae bacterium]|nr:adenylate/guanylate cyclase domain-containing protein [Acetobacteraceae bacterium]